MIALEGSIYVIFIKATEELMTGIDIFVSNDSMTLTYFNGVVLSQNWNRIPLNQAFVLYNPLINDS